MALVVMGLCSINAPIVHRGAFVARLGGKKPSSTSGRDISTESGGHGLNVQVGSSNSTMVCCLMPSEGDHEWHPKQRCAG